MSVVGRVPRSDVRGRGRGGGTLPCDLFHDACDVHLCESVSDITSRWVHGESSVHIYVVRVRLHQASASMLQQLCDDASNTVLIENKNAFQ